MQLIGKQLSFLTVEKLQITFGEIVKLASCLDPQRVLALNLMYSKNVEFKAPTEDHTKINDYMLHYISNMKNIRELKIKF